MTITKSFLSRVISIAIKEKVMTISIVMTFQTIKPEHSLLSPQQQGVRVG